MVKTTPPPNAKNIITSAPCQGPPLNNATSNAEYNKPQGSKAHTMPNHNGDQR
jgi:hypothetical protein